jgi:23S rRNA pseudouridine2605 synthase
MARNRPFRPNDQRSNDSKSRQRRSPGSGSGSHPRSTTKPGQHHSGSRSKGGTERPERAQTSAFRPTPEQPERLQKFLAHAGLGSRRACEQLILQGRVSVDGQVVKQLGTRVDPSKAKVAVDGEPVQLEKMVYYAVNKPKGYVATNFDPAGRPRVVDLLPEIPQRVYTVGRLDEASTGLMILTNDGALANGLAHPRYGVEKIYRALVAGLVGPEILAKLTEGVWLSDGKVRAKRARLVGRQGQATLLELVLAEGKKREIRRMLAKLGHKVMSLNRIAIGPITLKGLSAGECRHLGRHEVELLRKAAAGRPISPPEIAEGDVAGTRQAYHGPRGSRTLKHGAYSAKESAATRRSRRFQKAAAPDGRKSGRSRQGRKRSPTSADLSRPRRSEAGKPKMTGPHETHTGAFAGPKRATGPAPPRSQPPRARRIVGLEGEPTAGARPGSRGRPERKRPAARKRRPPGMGPRPRPTPPLRSEHLEGDDA